MAEPSIIDQLKALRAGDDAAARALAGRVTAPCAARIRDLLAVLHGTDKAEAAKAAGVLLEIELPAFSPVLAGVSPEPLEALVWDIQLLGDLVLGARAQLLAKLDGLLEDQRDVPMGDGPSPADEKPLPRRVCDEAYLLLRRLLARESEDAQYLNSRLYLGLSLEKRNSEIFFAKRERRFTRFDEE